MYLEVFNQDERFGLRFLRLNDKEKGMTIAFCGTKLATKLCLVYLEVELQENRCACCL